VDSAVIRLTPNAVQTAEAEPFLSFASACFRQKRKTLRNNLSGLFPKELVEAAPEAALRAEQLSIGALVDLYHRLAAA
jgi:16S rRNA (adenine1518-N6/adenine1519-N6)-dimethyltransferase